MESKIKFAAEHKLEDLENEILQRKKTHRSTSSHSHRSVFSSRSNRSKQPKLYSIESKFDIYSSKHNVNSNIRGRSSAKLSSRSRKTLNRQLSKQLSNQSIEEKEPLPL